MTIGLDYTLLSDQLTELMRLLEGSWTTWASHSWRHLWAGCKQLLRDLVEPCADLLEVRRGFNLVLVDGRCDS
jgi:hypothetical protein